MNFKLMADNQSLYNTPPTFAIYMSGLVFDWMLKQGGVPHFEEASKKKSERIYGVIESSKGFYWSPVDKSCRSRMNITYRICNPKTGDKDEALEKKVSSKTKKQKRNKKQTHCFSSSWRRQRKGKCSS